MVTRRRPLANLRREITLALIVKSVLLALLLYGLSDGRTSPRRVDPGLAEEHLLGRPAGAVGAEGTNDGP